MTGVYQQLEKMIESVADALGEELRDKFAFVGGCATSLLVTDRFTLQSVRYTEDVDLIVGLVGYNEWYKLQTILNKKGFHHEMNEEVICRMRLGELQVDFMPDDENVLGFTNRWYGDALANSQNYKLRSGQVIKLLTSEYFLATKFEAYLGRGNNDPMSSRDMEDIMTIIHGREELIDEVKKSKPDVKHYIAGQLSALRNHRDFANIVQSTARGNVEHEELLNYRIDELIKPGE